MKTLRKNIAHIFNLISMALKDEDFDDQEKKTIIKIATRLGLSNKDIENILNEQKIEIEVPLTLPERIEHLHDLVTVMLSDGIIHENELKYISKITKIYGFDDQYDKTPIAVDISDIKKKLSFQKFLDEFKKVTEGVLSSVVIDRDFNIKFPLYDSELLNLGPLPKALYIFFLIKDEELNIGDLSLDENKTLLKNIYSLMPSADFDVDSKIDRLTNHDGLSFNSNRSLIKKALVHALPKDNPELIKHYNITGARNHKKSIKLNKDLVQIQPKII